MGSRPCDGDGYLFLLQFGQGHRSHPQPVHAFRIMTRSYRCRGAFKSWESSPGRDELPSMSGEADLERPQRSNLDLGRREDQSDGECDEGDAEEAFDDAAANA
jgi:hypothetical protein